MMNRFQFCFQFQRGRYTMARSSLVLPMFLRKGMVSPAGDAYQAPPPPVVADPGAIRARQMHNRRWVGRCRLILSHPR
jgi:hypothetical protein